jgi:hypothetical protein
METVTEKIDTAKLPIKIEFVAKTIKTDWGDKPWPCFEWRVTFSNKSGQWVTPYFCGSGHIEYPKGKKNPYPRNVIGHEQYEREWAKPKAPSVDDVLHSLILDASASDYNLQDWCAEFGYSDDSIRALNTYRQCLETATNLRKYLGADVMRALAVQLQDH